MVFFLLRSILELYIKFNDNLKPTSATGLQTTVLVVVEDDNVVVDCVVASVVVAVEVVEDERFLTPVNPQYKSID